jgi:hypothetical protein
LRIGELADAPDEEFSAEYAALLPHFYIPLIMCFRERREHAIFQELLKSIPGLEERLVTGSDDEVMIVAELVGVIYHYIFGQQFYSLSLVDPERSIWCSC